MNSSILIAKVGDSHLVTIHHSGCSRTYTTSDAVAAVIRAKRICDLLELSEGVIEFEF